MFDSLLRSALQQSTPQVQIVGREGAVAFLKKNGFLAIDAYNQAALRLFGLSEKAEAIATETLLWEKDGYRLAVDIHDTKALERLVPFHTLEVKVPRSMPESPDNPMIVTDPDTNVSVIVFKGPLPKQFVYPGCLKCPDPHSIGAAGIVQLIGTVTSQGKAENVSVVITPGPAFTKAALETVQGWTFKSAVGTDGKPFATRANIEVTFPR